MTDAMVENQSVYIANGLLKMNIWDGEWFHIFLPITKNKEVNTKLLLPIFWGREKRVAISKCTPKKKLLTHFELTENTLLKENKWGIPEPIKETKTIEKNLFDVVLIPLLAYDKKGNRIGYGKGFYDDFLNNFKGIKIGLSFFSPTANNITPEAHDVALDYCVTPYKIWAF